MKITLAQYKFFRQTSHDQSGVTLILFTLFASALMVFVALTLNFGYRAYKRTDLQLGVDAAALAGAAELCGTRQCWYRSSAVADYILRANGVPATYTIRRGRWLPARPSGQQFEAFENSINDAWPSAWQTREKGIPAFIAANAVQVDAGQGVSLAGSFVPYASIVKASAIGLAAPVGDAVPVAPFAIPVCSLIDRDGEFKPEQVAKGDRFFTSIHRLCPSGVGTSCDIKPNFLWNPSENPAPFDLDMTNAPLGRFKLGVEPSWGWNGGENASLREYSNHIDHYGVVGLPEGASVPLDETSIRNIIRNDMWLQSSQGRLGDRFQVFAPGLKSRISDTIIWNRIRDRLNIYPSEHYALFEDSDAKYRYPNANLNLYYALFWNLFSGTPSIAPSTPPSQQGLCNSRRMSFYWQHNPSDYPYYNVPPQAPPQWSLPPNPPPNNTRDDHYEDMGIGGYFCGAAFHGLAPGTTDPTSFGPVWQVHVPVIAHQHKDGTPEPSACQGVNVDGAPASSEPDMFGLDDFPNSGINGRTYQIIGFMKVNIYDVDIGNRSPNPPHPFGGSLIPPVVTGCKFMGDPNAAPPQQPWSFDNGDSSDPDQFNCNLVRARVNSASIFPPSTNPLAEPGKPLLVQ